MRKIEALLVFAMVTILGGAAAHATQTLTAVTGEYVFTPFESFAAFSDGTGSIAGFSATVQGGPAVDTTVVFGAGPVSLTTVVGGLSAHVRVGVPCTTPADCGTLTFDSMAMPPPPPDWTSTGLYEATTPFSAHGHVTVDGDTGFLVIGQGTLDGFWCLESTAECVADASRPTLHYTFATVPEPPQQVAVAMALFILLFGVRMLRQRWVQP